MGGPLLCQLLRMKRPNILLLYTDQQRWDTIGAAGNPHILTPNLDALAAQGALFQHSYVNCPVCQPSRMSMLSGQYPQSLGIRFNGVEMPEEVPCLQHFLKRYGYRTGNIGKLHFKNHASAFRDHAELHPDYGFDTLILSDEPGCYEDAYLQWVREKDPSQVDSCRCSTPPAWQGPKFVSHSRKPDTPYVFEGPEELTHTAFVADQTSEFIRQSGNEPFFCIAGFYAPHAPINPPQRFLDLYDTSAMPLPERNPGENWKGHSEDHWRSVKAHYYALISHIDDQIGRILKALEESGKAEDTIVVFTSDHGENLGDHGRVGKCLWYDSSTRVPLIVRYPNGIPKGMQTNSLTEAVDLAPSLLDWCGIQKPPSMQGKSFRSILEGKAEIGEQRSSVFFELGRKVNKNWKAIKTKDILYCREGSGEEHLYDLQTDPHQLKDLATDPKYHETLQEGRNELLKRLIDSESIYPIPTGLY